MTFELFDPQADVSVRQGTLPHWYQAGVTYFITFRTEDSVPQELAAAWHAQRDAWLRSEGLDPTSSAWKQLLRGRPELERAFHATFTRHFIEYLDRGCGACVLARPELARIVADSLARFDAERYHLGDYVVMPNHVHVLVRLLGATEIERQCRSWKKFTAGRINRALGKQGRFWQEESFDHLVRSPEQFDALRTYIAENPKKAKLRPGEFLHYVCPAFVAGTLRVPFAGEQ
jgi:type I restriction enzyme R subunit